MNIKDDFCLSRDLLPAIAKLEMFTYSTLPIYRVYHLKFLESLVPWEKTSIFWDGPLFFNRGRDTFSLKKLFATYGRLKKIVCFKVTKGKIICKAKGNFLKYINIFTFLTQIGLNVKVSFSF